jgi:hypothetical protein
MKPPGMIGFAIVAMLASTAAVADAVTVASNVLGPEGTVYVDGNLYYGGWKSDTLSRWNGKQTAVLNRTPRCGHNGLTLTKQRTFVLACTNDPGAILELDMMGKQLRRWDVDSEGTTSVAFGDGESALYVTAAKDSNDPQARGGIVKSPNVE